MPLKVGSGNKRDTCTGDNLLCDGQFSQHPVVLMRRASISIKSGDGELVSK